MSNSAIDEASGVYEVVLTDEQINNIVHAISENKTVKLDADQFSALKTISDSNSFDFDFATRFDNLESGILFVVLGIGILIGILIIFFFRRK